MSSGSWMGFARAVGFRFAGARVWERGAAMAFFALLSLAPLFLLLLSFFDRLFGTPVMRQEIYLGLVRGLGPETASAIQALALQPGVLQGDLATMVINAVITAFAGTALFRHMQTSLGVIWTAPHKDRRPFLPRLVGQFLRSFFAMGALAVVGVGSFFLLAAALLTGPLVEGFLFPFGVPVFWGWVTGSVGLLGALVVFATLYLTLAPERPSARRVSITLLAVLVGLLMSRTVMGLYTQGNGVFSLFGAGSAVVHLLFWCFLLSQLFLAAAVVGAVATDRASHD